MQSFWMQYRSEVEGVGEGEDVDEVVEGGLGEGLVVYVGKLQFLHPYLDNDNVSFSVITYYLHCLVPMLFSLVKSCCAHTEKDYHTAEAYRYIMTSRINLIAPARWCSGQGH